MIRKYRTRTQRLEAMRVTLDMTKGRHPWPDGYLPSNVLPGDYLVRYHGSKHWVSAAPAVFEELYELDQPAELLRIVK